MRQYTDIFGKQWEMECMGCAIASGEMDVPGGILHETGAFLLHQDPTNPIPGFLIIALKRHISSFADFSPEEKAEFSAILFEARNALNTIEGFKFCTIIQEERAPHFHAWILPYYDWMDGIKHGTINDIIPLLTYSKENWKTSDKIDLVLDAAAKVKKHFAVL